MRAPVCSDVYYARVGHGARGLKTDPLVPSASSLCLGGVGLLFAGKNALPRTKPVTSNYRRITARHPRPGVGLDPAPLRRSADAEGEVVRETRPIGSRLINFALSALSAPPAPDATLARLQTAHRRRRRRRGPTPVLDDRRSHRGRFVAAVSTPITGARTRCTCLFVFRFFGSSAVHTGGGVLKHRMRGEGPNGATEIGMFSETSDLSTAFFLL